MSLKVDRLPTSAQFNRLIDKIDHLTYNTKARMLNSNRTVKDVALLSLRDKDGYLLDIQKQSLSCAGRKHVLKHLFLDAVADENVTAATLCI